MKTSTNRVQIWLAGGAVGVMLALLITPATSWLVRSQLRCAVPISPPLTGLSYLGFKGCEGDYDRTQKAEDEFAARHPNDMQIQMATALDRSSHLLQNRNPDESDNPAVNQHHSRAWALRPLIERFPEDASLRANFLRLAAGNEMRCGRDEEILLSDRETRSKPLPKPGAPISKEIIQIFLADADAGERLEPDNGFYPFMRAIALFAAHRDQEALEAIARAGHCSEFREHYEDEVYGRLRILEEGLGEHGSIPKVAVSAAVLFPHFAAMRNAARVTTAKAIQAEESGDPQTGVRIRQDLIRAGLLLHNRAHSIIGMLVGDAIMRLAISRPGGAEPIKFNSKIPNDERQRQQVERFAAWLEELRHGQEAEWSREVFAEITRVRKAITPIPDAVDVTMPLRSLSFAWLGNVLLLCNAAWLLVAGGLAAVVMRRTSIRAGRPLSLPVRIGVGFGAPFTAILFTAALEDHSLFPVLLLGGAATALLMGLLAFAKHWTGVKRGMAAAFATMAVASGAIFLAGIQAQATGALIKLWAAMLSVEGSSPPSDPPLLTVALTALMWAVPIGLGFAIGVVSLVCRVPLSVGLVRGFQGLAVPAGCILIGIYAVTLVPTVRQEAHLSYMNQRWIKDEVRWVAEVKGISLVRTNVLQNMLGPETGQ